MFSYKYRYFIITGLGGYSFMNTIFIDTFQYYHIRISNSILVTIFIASVFIVWESNRIIQRNIKKNYYFFKKKIDGPYIQFLISNLCVAFLISIPAYLFAHFYFGYSQLEMLVPLKLLLLFSFRVNLFLNTINFIIYYIEKLKETQLKAEKFKKMGLQAQFQSLRNQINPHFLFNSMNVLSTLVYKDPQIASEFIMQLCNVYRYVLKHSEKDLVTLQEEINFIKSYLFTLQKRFGSSLSITFSIDDCYFLHYIIPVSLQMLIENAIKHNVVSRRHPLNIQVYCQEEFVIVTNTIYLRNVRGESTKIGLSNLKRRYQLLGGKNVIIDCDENNFTVKLPLFNISNHENSYS